MSTWARYLVWQLPGWLVAALVLAWLRPRAELSWQLVVGAWLVWITKDLVLYPLVRSAYERAPTGAERLVGSSAVAETDLAPWGQVRIGAELWRARSDGGPVARGARVVVTHTEGLTLHVSDSA
jgi:membrane-bound serine protease (ClpP class)